MSGWQTRFWNSSDMTRSKKIFVAIAIVFFVLLLIVVADISRRTTFPGAKTKSAPGLTEDSVARDSMRTSP